MQRQRTAVVAVDMQVVAAVVMLAADMSAVAADIPAADIDSL
jgi:hypothetical protein